MSFDLNSLMRPRRVCLCKNVTKEDLQNAYHKGADTLEKLLQMTKACSGCTSCFDEVQKIYTDLTLQYPPKSSEKKSCANDPQQPLPLDN